MLALQSFTCSFPDGPKCGRQGLWPFRSNEGPETQNNETCFRLCSVEGRIHVQAKFQNLSIRIFFTAHNALMGQVNRDAQPSVERCRRRLRSWRQLTCETCETGGKADESSDTKRKSQPEVCNKMYVGNKVLRDFRVKHLCAQHAE